MFAGFGFFMGMVYFFFDKKLCFQYFEYYSTSLLVCAGLLCVYFLKSGAAQISDMSRFGWFHFCSALVIGLGARFLIFSLKKKNALHWLFLGGIVCFIALLPMKEPIVGGFKFLFAKDFLYKTVGELQPLMTEHGELMSFNKIFDFFGPEYFLFFLIWVYPPKNLFNRNGRVVRDFLALFMLLTLNQVRFCRWIAGPLGIFSAVIVYQIVRLLRPAINERKMPKLALGMILVPIFVLSLNNKFMFLNRSNEIYQNRIEGYNWIQENTPVTSGYSDEKTPEYGVLSFWDRGNEITCFARRPAVVSNTLRGLGTMAMVFSSETEAEAYEKCKNKRIRYILTEPTYFSNDYMAFLKCVSENASGPEFLFVSEEDEKKYAGAKLVESFYHWLTFKAGMKSQAKFGISQHFMLVWVSEAKIKGAMPAVMLYQAVEGAQVVGKTKPGQRVRLALNVAVDKVLMDYSQETTSDKDGNYSFRVCYPTKNLSGKVETDEFYTLLISDEKDEVKIPLKISLDWVLSGKRIIIE
jgi:asparagine N-glycosylation enzyme membrane subunit Stt3